MTTKSTKEPITLDSMSTDEFNSIMQTGLSQAKDDESLSYTDVLADLRQSLNKP